MEDGVLGLARQLLLRGGHFADQQRLRRPPRRVDRFLQLRLRLGKSDVHSSFAVSDAFEQKLKPKRGLSSAGISFDEVEVPCRQAAVQYLVEAGDTGARQLSVVPRSG